MIRPSSCLQDVEWTTTGVSGYHFKTSSTTSAGVAEEGSPTRSESAWSGFIQKRAPSLSPTGRTSSVWAVKRGEHGTEETGGPMVSIRAWIEGLLLRAFVHAGFMEDTTDHADIGTMTLMLICA